MPRRALPGMGDQGAQPALAFFAQACGGPAQALERRRHHRLHRGAMTLAQCFVAGIASAFVRRRNV